MSILKFLGFTSKKASFPSDSGIYLFNTLTNKKDLFVPLKPSEVSMYHCGPTVYNFAHVGNLRSYVFADILRRTIELNGYKVHQVINITDVGHLVGDGDQGNDKVEEEARKTAKSAKQITDFYTNAFFDDLKKLHIEIEQTVFPRATEHITEQINLIKKLHGLGYTYKISDGIYFNTAKFKAYGKLGNINLKGLEEGARIGVNAEKKNPTDFALWKFSPKNEKREQEWLSPWGIGFPGWHIECSAMSMKYLGETFDIHTGGIDHIPVHHNNEIAQSECATGKPYVKYWLHNAFVNVPSGKMAKSVGNHIRLGELETRGVHPLAYRYWLLTAHYRSQITFSFEALDGASRAYTRLIRMLSELPKGGTIHTGYKEKFKKAVSDDLDTPKALALMWDLLKDTSVSNADKKATVEFFDSVFGLALAEAKHEKTLIPELVLELVEKREEARMGKDFVAADTLRKQISDAGYEVKDTDSGPKISLK